MMTCLEEINLEKVPENSFLLDTCFLLHELEIDNEKKLEDFCKRENVFITSFNYEELEKVERRIHKIKHKVKKFLDKGLLKRINIDIHPGDNIGEKIFADRIDTKIISKIHDPSDAILVACAIKTKSNILTRDKKHIFTTEIENYLSDKNIIILNSIKD